MKNHWKTISIISWVVLAIVLALGIILTVSAKHENAALKAEIAEYKSLAAGGENEQGGSASSKDSQESSSDSKGSNDKKDQSGNTNNGANNNGVNNNGNAGQNVVYVEKEVPKYIYVASEPEKKDTPVPEPQSEEQQTEPQTDESGEEETKDESNKANLAFATGVTYQMCDADYWISKLENPDTVLKTPEEIAAFNETIVETQGTNMYDLNSIGETFNGNTLKESLANDVVPSDTMYKNRVLMSAEEKAAYFEEIKTNIRNAQTTDSDTVKYAVVSRRADMKAWPTPDFIGYSSDDTDEELTLSSMNINEPFVVKLITGDGKYAWGYSNICTGWVSTEDLAFCKDKEEWNDSWNMTDDNFLVVIMDRLTLEPSYLTPATSALKLMIGTKLKLVPEDNVPEMIGERNRINNYVVYVPTRDENGNYVKSMALISQNKEMGVHKGYVPLTSANLIELAFNCLGDRYGWGGMLESMDCSAYTRAIYSCCGMELPRNTNWQTATPSNNYKFDVDAAQDDQKKDVLNNLLPGALLKFSGHIVLYLGEDNGEYYAISAVGSYLDPDEDHTFKSIQSIALTPLSVTRGARYGYTSWLTNITDFICPWNF